MKLVTALWLALTMLLLFALPAPAQQSARTAATATATGSAAAPTAAQPSPPPTPTAAMPPAAAAPPQPRAPAPQAPPGGQLPAPQAQPNAQRPAVPASAQNPPVDGATYAVRLRDLEARVDQLKEQIRRSHTRLSLLSDTILSGGVGGARAEIVFRNNMSSAFRLTRVLVVLDGAVQYNKEDDTGTLAAQGEIPIFSGSIPPGDHTLQVRIGLRGHGYGVFSYLRGYKFEQSSSHSFTVTEGKTIELEVIAWEKGGVTTPLEQRPAVRYTERLRSGTASSSTSSGGTRGSTGGSGSVRSGGR